VRQVIFSPGTAAGRTGGISNGSIHAQAKPDSQADGFGRRIAGVAGDPVVGPDLVAPSRAAASTSGPLDGFAAQVAAAMPRLLEPAVFVQERLTVLARGLRWGEGPVFDSQHRLYFTDVKAGRILRWTNDGSVRGKLPGRLEVVLRNSGGANGLAFDADGNLVACLGNSRRLVRWSLSADGLPVSRTVLAAGHGGRGFTGPNDLWIDQRGGVYFTDTRFWSRTRSPQGGFHLYYLAPGQEKPLRMTTGMRLKGPNGVAGTADGKVLYLADLPAKNVWRFDVDAATGGLSNRRLFARAAVDGLEVDPLNGDVFMGTARGVAVYRPDGSLRRTIRVPGGGVNLAFGTGPNADTLFVTAPSAVYAYSLDPARRA
jgi:gluconolactonase